jgi:hypothetical protein
MTDPEQVTIDGEFEPIPGPEPSGNHEQDHLFDPTATPTVPGQLAMLGEV